MNPESEYTFSTFPYPGLWPFNREEADIFFRREKQINQLLNKLGTSRFLAVLGPSGCGKSSLIRAGLIPYLEAGFIAGAGSQWRIAEMRPGDRPLLALAKALLKPEAMGAEWGGGADAVPFLAAELRRGPLALVESMRRKPLPPGTNLLILVDQFEEIFRMEGRLDPDEGNKFADLLLETLREAGKRGEGEDLPAHLIITMRSDFLGDCALFRGLPEAITDNLYLTPRLTREQTEAAIVGPARVCGGEADPALANRLLNEIGPDPDQLPVLQHALMRMWRRMLEKFPEEGANGPAEKILALAHYKDIGETLGSSLDRHAEEVYGGLEEDRKPIAETMFRCLTQRAMGQREPRRPAGLGEIAEVAGAPWETVAAVAEVFRREDCNFVVPPPGEPLRPETTLDIGHESLIRQWRTLADWVKEEAKSAEIYRRMRDWALRWEQGEAELWGGTDLSVSHTWWERERPSPDWAERYGSRDEFKLAMKFLDASEEAQRKAIAAEKEKRASELRRARRMAWGFGLLATILVVGILLYYVAEHREFDAYYNSFVKVRGVPEGIGLLTADQVRHRALSYKVTKRGRCGPVVRMEAVNSTGQPTIGSGVFSGFEGSSTDVSPSQVQESRWEYVYDAKEKVAHEVSLDRFGRRVRSVTYAPSDSETGNTRTAYLIGRDGSLAPQQRSCQAFVSYDYRTKATKR